MKQLKIFIMVIVVLLFGPQAFLESSLRGQGKESASYETARQILGNDFISPSEVSQARGLPYTGGQLKHFEDIMPLEEVLRWCKANNYAVMAGPPEPASLLEICSLKPELFMSGGEGWYSVDQKFAASDKATNAWFLFRKEPVPNSTNKSWDEQSRLLLENEQVPNAGEISWFITTFYEVRGVRLFEGFYIRTSSVVSDSDGFHISVGVLDSRGLFISSFWDSRRFSDVGISSARKF